MASEQISMLCRSSAVCQPGCIRVPGDGDVLGALLEQLDVGEGLLHLRLDAHDADVRLHRVLQRVLDLVRTLRITAAARCALAARAPLRRGVQLSGVELHGAVLLGELRGVFARALAEDHQVDSEFPPRRFAPCKPAAHSPAAKRPGTFVICVSPSTRMPPMM